MQIYNPFVQLNGCTIINNEAQEQYQPPQYQLPQPRQVQPVKKDEIILIPAPLFWGGGGILALAMCAALSAFNPNVVVVNNQSPPININNTVNK